MTKESDTVNLYVIRLRNGNCVVTAAPDETRASANVAASSGTNSEIASVRPVTTFNVQFVLSDTGELEATMFDKASRAELLAHEYPLLQAAEQHSFIDFGRNQSGGDATANLYSRDRLTHEEGWPRRDREIIQYAVAQERLRFSN